MRDLLKDIAALDVAVAQSVCAGETITIDPSVYIGGLDGFCHKCGGSGVTHQLMENSK